MHTLHNIQTRPFTDCEYVCMCMHMHTYGCIDIHMPRHLVHAYADICIHTHSYACICKHMYTNACVRAYVCILSCISAVGMGEGHPENLTQPIGGGGRRSWVLMHIYIYIYIYICAYIHIHICMYAFWFFSLSSFCPPPPPRWQRFLASVIQGTWV